METKQKSTQSIEKSINEIWKNNPKIPFMQSKEILTLGYKLGLECSNNTNISSKKTNDEHSDFVGTPKELITYADKKIKEEKKEDKSQYKKVFIKTSELDICKAKYELLDQIVGFIKNNHDLIETYNHINSMLQNESKKYKELKTSNERKH